jgi:hypothetical protein
LNWYRALKCSQQVYDEPLVDDYYEEDPEEPEERQNPYYGKENEPIGEAAQSSGFNIGPVYHGTDEDFNQFENRGGKVQVLFSTFDVQRHGFFFSPDYQVAETFGKNVIVAYLSLRNPADFMDNNVWFAIRDKLVEKGWNERYLDYSETWELFDDEEDDDKGKRFVSELKSLGFDGAIIEEPAVEREREHGVAYVVFDPSQIKSVAPVTRSDEGQEIPLSSRFDPTSPDIRYCR